MILLVYAVKDSDKNKSGKRIKCIAKNYTDVRKVRCLADVCQLARMNPKLTETDYGFRMVVEV